MTGFYYLRNVIWAYREVSDPAGLGKLLFSVEAAYRKHEVTEPKKGAELAAFHCMVTAFGVMGREAERQGG